MRVAESHGSILIVDDTPENLTRLSRILTQRGYQVQAVDNGTQAIQSAQTTPPDLILLDIAMPVMDGFETCERLKLDERTRQIPIIFISASDSSEEKVKAFHAGGVDYVLKPLEMEEVEARVETHLAILQMRLELQALNRELTTRVEELTRSQELLREREAELSAFVNALPNLSFVYDEEGRYLEILATETHLLSARAEELKGRLITDVLPAEAAGLMMDAIRHTIDTGKPQVIEYKIPVLSGEERWFEGRIALMERGRSGHSKVVFIANEISERVQLYEKVQQLAMQDPLTGCFNRRHFFERAEQEMQRTLRYQRPLAIMMLDIDQFKQVNDRFGHPTGDEVLCHLVHLCQNQMRANDLLGRYGGDEFAILMPETQVEGARQAAERLQTEIRKISIDRPEGKCSVTVSIGVAGVEAGCKEARTVAAVIKCADQAFYTAKAAGQNCVRTG
ncbi:MAG: diguanylate cyclase [Anaerolineales bacterium]|jgi:diguanylate cyclase (GGDEF)-like protein/PAS domain S-box-containing protein